jgi:hypothetical protein
MLTSNRFVKLLGVCGSEHAGATLAIERLRRCTGLTWAELLRPPLAGADPGAGPNVQGQEDVPIPRWMRDRDQTWLRYASERDGSRFPWSPCPRARPPGATGMRGRTHEEEDHCQTPRPPPGLRSAAARGSTQTSRTAAVAPPPPAEAAPAEPDRHCGR